jgi:hypothetical protein
MNLVALLVAVPVVRLVNETPNPAIRGAIIIVGLVVLAAALYVSKSRKIPLLESEASSSEPAVTP